MYNGFDWYGRTLEVREVNELRYRLDYLSSLHVLFRTAMPVFPAQAHFVVASAASVVVVACVAVSGVVSGVASGVDMRRGPAAISRVKIFMQIIQDRNNLVDMVVSVWTAMAVATVGAMVTSSLSQASKLWFAT